MSRRLDPPHDRVTLSSEERSSLEQLERTFAAPAAVRHPPAVEPHGRIASARAWLLAHLRWVLRAGPALVVIGLVVMFSALPSSTAVSALGAVLVLLGVAAMVRRPWRRWRGRVHRLGNDR